MIIYPYTLYCWIFSRLAPCIFYVLQIVHKAAAPICQDMMARKASLQNCLRCSVKSETSPFLTRKRVSRLPHSAQRFWARGITQPPPQAACRRESLHCSSRRCSGFLCSWVPHRRQTTHSDSRSEVKGGVFSVSLNLRAAEKNKTKKWNTSKNLEAFHLQLPKYNRRTKTCQWCRWFL